MITTYKTFEAPADEIVDVMAGRLRTPAASVCPFAEFTEAVTELLRAFDKPGCHLVGAGHVTPEIAIAADRAKTALVEALGTSPFSADVDSILPAIHTPHDLIYLANPNRVTGVGFTVMDLDKLVRAVPSGIVIVDEFYYDYSGISALPLLDILTNLVILRSFPVNPDLNFPDAGFILASPTTIESVSQSRCIRPPTSSFSRMILASLTDDETWSSRLSEIHEEVLRVTSALSRLGIQCRLTAADFLLLRAASPKNVGNFLARYEVPIENLDGYPQLRNYLRYPIQSPNVNDRIIEAFKKMPPEYYRMKNIDNRPVTIRRPADFPADPKNQLLRQRIPASVTKRRRFSRNSE